MSENIDKLSFDGQMVSLFKKIKIPKNPITFYFNINSIEKDLSSGIKEYFTKGISEFINPLNGDNISERFLYKVYYYTGFLESIQEHIYYFLEDIKFYDIGFYLKSIVFYDKKNKYKIYALLENRPDLLIKISQTDDIEKILSEYSFLKDYDKKDFDLVLHNFEKYFYSLSSFNDSEKIKFIYDSFYINILKHKVSYKETKLSYLDFIKTEDFNYYKSLSQVFGYIVSNYDRNDKLKEKQSLICKISIHIKDKKKIWFLKKNIKQDIKDKFAIGKKLHFDKDNYFENDKEFMEYLVTYHLNKKYKKLTNIFYFNSIKERFSENKWAKLGGINFFVFDNIVGDKNVNMFLFFKEFKNNLIDIYNSFTWPFIKPYFYYILVFKSVKMQLKDWQKLFFLLMFFSAENYSEYLILQKIYKSIENIGLWNVGDYASSFFKKVGFFILRLGILLKEFYTSIILISLFIIGLWFSGLINIIIMFVLFVLFSINILKYVFFPGRFEILRTFGIVIFTLLGYVWFTTVFPKISQPQYVSYLGKQVQSLVSLDFSGGKQNYYSMVSYIYGKNYKNYEKELITKVSDRIYGIKDNKNIKSGIKVAKNAVTGLWKEYNQKWIPIKKGTYLKYYIDREINKIPLTLTQKRKLSQKVVKEYISWYCSMKNDIYCKTKLERLPVGFKLNLTKIKYLVNKG